MMDRWGWIDGHILRFRRLFAAILAEPEGIAGPVG